MYLGGFMPRPVADSCFVQFILWSCCICDFIVCTFYFILTSACFCYYTSAISINYHGCSWNSPSFSLPGPPTPCPSGLPENRCLVLNYFLPSVHLSPVLSHPCIGLVLHQVLFILTFAFFCPNGQERTWSHLQALSSVPLPSLVFSNMLLGILLTFSFLWI